MLGQRKFFVWMNTLSGVHRGRFCRVCARTNVDLKGWILSGHMEQDFVRQNTQCGFYQDKDAMVCVIVYYYTLYSVRVWCPVYTIPNNIGTIAAYFVTTLFCEQV